MFPLLTNAFSNQTKCITTLQGQRGPISSLAFSPSGEYLASGGVEGLKIWNVSKNQCVEMPRHVGFYERAQVSALCWVTRTKEGREIICYGNVMGFLVFLQHRPEEGRFEVIASSRIGKGGEIVCIAVDTSTPGITRIATGTRDKCVQIWSFNAATRVLAPLHSKAYEEGKGIIPKALAFENNGTGNLYVFGLYDGGLYCYDGKTAENISKHQLGSQIGNAVIDVKRNICIIDNVANGFDAYKIDSGAHIQEFGTRDAKKTHPKGVALGNNSTLVIGGSDHGKVYIFDRKSGSLLRTLNHRRNGGVETIAVYDKTDGDVYIASASSTTSVSEKCPIHIWQWRASRKSSGSGRKWTFMGLINMFCQMFVLAVFVAGAAYAYQIRIRGQKGSSMPDIGEAITGIYQDLDKYMAGREGQNKRAVPRSRGDIGEGFGSVNGLGDVGKPQVAARVQNAREDRSLTRADNRGEVPEPGKSSFETPMMPPAQVARVVDVLVEA